MKNKLLLLFTCGLILVTGCSSKDKDNKVTNSSDVKVEINETEGLSLKTYNGKNDDMIFVIKNESTEIVDYISVDIAFYNEEGKLIKTDKQYARNLLVGKEYITKLNLVEYTEAGKTKLPNNIEVTINKTNYSNDFEEIHTEKVNGKVEKTENEGELFLTITNDSGKVLDELSTAVVFYKNSKPVDANIKIFQQVDVTSTATIYIPTYVEEKEIKYLDYDEVEVIINNASTYIQ